jgi:hypothetical protein
MSTGVTQRKVTPGSALLQKLENAQRPSQAALFAKQSRGQRWILLGVLVVFSALIGYVVLPNNVAVNLGKRDLSRQYDEWQSPDVGIASADEAIQPDFVIQSESASQVTPSSSQDTQPTDIAYMAQMSSEEPGSPSPAFSDYDSNGGVQTAGTTPLINYLSRDLFENLFPHRDTRTRVNPYYTYDNLVAAASAYPQFAAHADQAVARREVAAFLAHVAYSTLPSGTVPGPIEEWFVSRKAFSD